MSQYLTLKKQEVDSLLKSVPAFFERSYNIDGHKIILYGYHFILDNIYKENSLAYEIRSLVYDETENKFYEGYIKCLI